jgi:hypothetical protein
MPLCETNLTSQNLSRFKKCERARAASSTWASPERTSCKRFFFQWNEFMPPAAHLCLAAQLPSPLKASPRRMRVKNRLIEQMNTQSGLKILTAPRDACHAYAKEYDLNKASTKEFFYQKIDKKLTHKYY